MGLHVQRRQRWYEKPSWRKRRKPGRDDQSWPADPSGIHGYDWSLHRLLHTGKADFWRDQRADLCCTEEGRRDQRQEVWRSGGSAACIRSFRSKSFHAWYDGHHPEPRTERCCSRGLRKEDRQPEICIWFLQKIYPDVLRRCYGDQQSKIWARSGWDQGSKGREVRYRPGCRWSEGSNRTFQSSLQRRIGQGFPAGSGRAADGGCKGRIPLLGQPACHCLQTYERYPGWLGNRCQRTDHGIW